MTLYLELQTINRRCFHNHGEGPRIWSKTSQITQSSWSLYIDLIYDGSPRGQHHLTRAGVGRARLLQQEQVTRDTRDNNVAIT